jgi:histidinol-phosphate aminotransferase
MDRRRFLGTSAAWAGVAGVGGLGSAAQPLEGLERSWAGLAGASRQSGPLRLMYNENPLGLSPRAWQAVLDAKGYANLYPEEQHEKLVTMLAERLGVKPANLVVGNGSTEILQMAIQAAAGPGVPLVLADPTYEDIMVYQAPHAFEVIRVPLDARMAHDLGRMREIVDGARRPAVVYVCNPNNPTGTITSSRALDAWIEEAPETTLFLMDEAYYEYADDPDYWSAAKFIDRPNVVTIRTFSKIFAMAGMRLGYAIAHPDTAARLNQFILTVSTNAFALAAGIASMEDTELVPRSVALNAESKRITQATLDQLGLEYLPTQANFLMHRVKGDVRPYIASMLEAGIRVGRPFPPMDEWNRVSFGLPEHMERWSEAIRGLRRTGVV